MFNTYKFVPRSLASMADNAKSSKVGANDDPDAKGSDDKTADDLKYLAELGAQNSPKTNIAYEPWCFSPRVNDWEHCWRIIQKVVSSIPIHPSERRPLKCQDHPNLGLCLDSAQMAIAPSYGFDPLTGKGCTEEGYKALLDRIRKLPAEKIFYFEVSDVLPPRPPLTQGSDFDGWHEKNGIQGKERMTWVMNARSVPYIGRKAGKAVHGPDDMGSARVDEVFAAVLSTGFRGKSESLKSWRYVQSPWLTEIQDPSSGNASRRLRWKRRI